MQTILGSGGVIGVELAKALKSFNTSIRLVSRKPQKVNTSDELYVADLNNPDELSKAIKGSEVVYFTAGFPYSVKVWKKTWPTVIKSVIEACKQHEAKLVFFDNIYMYDQNYLSLMTEETPINPPSKKGVIREQVARMIMDEVKAGKLTALIARSADFYGPGIKNSSMLTETGFNNLAEGKKANWLSSVEYKHSFTYTPDAGKATALLGNTPDAYNEIWHLPTAKNPPTGKEWIYAIASAMGKQPKYMVLSKGFVRFLGFFIPIMGEIVEMMYQYDRDYIFDSSKFENKFDFQTTSYLDGIKEIIEKDYS